VCVINNWFALTL